MYSKKAADILQMKEQNHVEFNNLNADKNFLHEFASQWLGDMKYVLNMVDNNVNNFSSYSLSLSAGEWL